MTGRERGRERERWRGRGALQAQTFAFERSYDAPEQSVSDRHEEARQGSRHLLDCPDVVSSALSRDASLEAAHNLVRGGRDE